LMQTNVHLHSGDSHSSVLAWRGGGEGSWAGET
jgi:hypothetical protein